MTQVDPYSLIQVKKRRSPASAPGGKGYQAIMFNPIQLWRGITQITLASAEGLAPDEAARCRIRGGGCCTAPVRLAAHVVTHIPQRRAPGSLEFLKNEKN